MHMTATIAIRSRDSSSGIGCWWSVSIGPRQWLIRNAPERSESCSSTAPCWRREQGHSGTVAPIDVSTQHPSVLSSCEPSEKKTCLACKSLQHLFFFFVASIVVFFLFLKCSFRQISAITGRKLAGNQSHLPSITTVYFHSALCSALCWCCILENNGSSQNWWTRRMFCWILVPRILNGNGSRTTANLVEGEKHREGLGFLLIPCLITRPRLTPGQRPCRSHSNPSPRPTSKGPDYREEKNEAGEGERGRGGKTEGWKEGRTK